MEKVLGLQDKYEQLQAQLSDPEVISDMKKYVQLNKEYKELAPIIKAGQEYKKMMEDYEAAKDIIANEKDEELREMAKDEIAEIEPKIPDMEQNIKLLLIPADPQDSKNAIMEIRGGTGGDEAAIFAGDLFRMYSKYIERRGWKMEVTHQSEGAAGGFKEIVFKVIGDGVYGVLKYESGVHRVQRVPQTETQGRGRTVCEHDIFGYPPDAHPFRYSGAVPGREVTAEEFRQGSGRAPYTSVQYGVREISQRDFGQAQDNGLYRGPFGKDPYVQLSSVACDGPSYQLYYVQSSCLHGRGYPGGPGPAADSRERGTPQGCS